jgi:hypothetical protein
MVMVVTNMVILMLMVMVMRQNGDVQNAFRLS